MATVDDLSVKVSAQTADFTAGMNVAERGLSGLRSDALQTAGAMQLLQGRMDEAGDEATTAGAKASASSGGFLAAAGGAATAEVSFGSLSVMTIGTLIPSLLALSTVLAPLTAGLLGFITVAGAIGGIGLVGFIGAVMTNTEMLKQTFTELVNTIKTEFAPVFDTFAVVLQALMEDLTAIIPELVPAQTVISRLAAQFDLLGVAVIESLPAFVDLAITLANQFLPPFARWVDDILPRVPGMLQGLIPTMVSVGKALGPMVSAFLEIAPTMTEFGLTILNLVTPALTGFLNIWNDAMAAINGLGDGAGELVATLTILSPVIAKIGMVLAGLSNPALAAVAAVGLLAGAVATDFGGIRGIIRNFGREVGVILGQNVPTLLKNVKTIIGTLLPVIEPVFRFIAQYLSKVLINAIDLVISSITALSQVLVGDFGGALATMRGFLDRWIGRSVVNFGELADSIKSTLVNGAITAVSTLVAIYQRAFFKISNFIANIWNSISSDLVNGFNAVISTIVSGLNTVISRVNSAVQTAKDANLPGSGKLGTFSELEAGSLGSQSLDLQSNRTTDMGQLAQQNEQTIRLVLDERTDIVEGRIKEGANRVVETKERRTQRNTGRNASPR